MDLLLAADGGIDQTINEQFTRVSTAVQDVIFFPVTVAGAAAAGLVGIAIEARGTIVVDRPATVAAADAAGLFLLALDPDEFLKETTP